jgi:hypothetical protein
MNDRPIIFSGPMVRAILEGRKTQTRRVIKPQPTEPANTPWLKNGWLEPSRCPHGQPGDRLWVKETFFDNRKYEAAVGFKIGVAQDYDYKADHEVAPDSKVKWIPSIFMPRWASRITLEITDMRVQRVQDISEEDAKAEGVDYPAEGPQSSYRLAFSKLWDAIQLSRSKPDGAYAW